VKIDNYLSDDPTLGITIDGSSIQLPAQFETRQLRYYSATTKTAETIRHNLEWAQTGEGAPEFQFVYLMLPTRCNQKCAGCFVGQDKGRLPKQLSGPFFSKQELDQIFFFAREHGAQAIVYSGGGELFTWRGALGFVEQAKKHGLNMMIFTNGTLLDRDKLQHLNQLGVALTVSLRDTTEHLHNTVVGFTGFRRAIVTIQTAMDLGMHEYGRLAVEIPVNKNNEGRIINDLLPVLRACRIVPMIEEYITTLTSEEENKWCHTFPQAREFFKKLAYRDAELGTKWQPEYGTRMLAQPKCRRPLYSFAIFPNGEVVDCPTNTVSYGNLREQNLYDIVYSDRFRKAVLSHELCPCSVFYTESSQQIPQVLPKHLQRMKGSE